MKLSPTERTWIIIGTFAGLGVSYIFSQLGYLPVCIAVGYAIGFFFGKEKLDS